MPAVTLSVNGASHTLQLEGDARLLTVLREELGLTGAKYGCGEGQCGACTVLVGDRAVRSCITAARTVAGQPITTIEGLAAGRSPAPRAAGVSRCRGAPVWLLHAGNDCERRRAAACHAQTRPIPDRARHERQPVPVRRLLARRGGHRGGRRDRGGHARAEERAMSPRRPATPPPVEPERYELASEPAYRFELRRREMLKLVGGGVLVGVLLERSAGAQESGRGNRLAEDLPDDVGAWVQVNDQGRIVVSTGKAEIGQNIRTSLTQAVADELRVPADAVTVVMADTARTPFDAGTFGSGTTPFMAPQLRRAAAAARAALIDLAAARWQVDVSELDAADGQVRHTRSGRTAAYGELTRGQRLARVIGEALMLPRSEWRLAGTPMLKVDGRAFVTGHHAYAYRHDPAADAPRRGRPPARHRRRPGVVRYRCRGGGRWGQCSARRRLHRSHGTRSRQRQTSGFARAGRLARVPHRITGGISSSTCGAAPHHRRTPRLYTPADWSRRVGVSRYDTLDATYTVAYIAHVPLEPRTAVAEWEESGLTVWTGTQRPFGVRRELADAFHLPVERIRSSVPDTGSAYGGKHTGETAIEAARLAKAAGRPVKVTWTREEEFTSVYFRPAGVIDVSSGLDADGRLLFWAFDNINAGTAGVRTPYAVPHQRIAFMEADSPLRQGSYRGLAATANNFARESHIDELASLAGLDPVEFRLRHIEDPRLKGVLQAAADRAKWGRTAGGAHLGIACGFEREATSRPQCQWRWKTAASFCGGSCVRSTAAPL